MKKLAILSTILAAGGGSGWWWLRPEKEAAAELAAAHVKRGSFRVSITEQGSFAAKESIEIKVQPEAFHNQLTITQYVAAGTVVAKDTVLLEFDRGEITRIISQAQMDLQAAENDLVQAREDMKIQKLQNSIDLERARYSAQVAEQNLTKWTDLEAPKAIKEAEARVTDAETALKEAKTNYEVLQLMKKDDLVGDAEVERAKLAERKAENDLEFAKMQVKLLQVYEHPLALKRLQNEVRDTKAFADGKESANESLIRQKESAELRAKNAVEEKTAYLAKLKRDSDRMTVKAPCDGMFLHGSNEPWRQPTEMKVGAKVQPHDQLGSIPDLSAFRIKLGVSEADVNKVKPGMTATIRPEALPDLTMTAKVRTVSAVTSANRWWNPDSGSKFDVELDLDGIDARIKPGMKCKVEIAVDEANEVLHLPLDAVFEKDGKSICWLLGGASPEIREVKVGRSSSDYVEIVEGLKDGDRVSLTDPNKK